MSKIKDLPILERPREKASKYGISKLANYELLSIIISSGGKDNSALQIAFDMLSDNLGIVNLFHLNTEELQKYKGIGKAKALKLSACFELLKRYYIQRIDEENKPLDPDSLYQKFMVNAFSKENENCYLIILNRQKILVKQILLFSGNDKNVSISSTEIIRQVLLANGKYFYLIHNHPDGNMKPSNYDISFTLDLINASKKMNIFLLDHFIYTEQGYYSIVYDFTRISKNS